MRRSVVSAALALFVLVGLLAAVGLPWRRHHVAWAGRPLPDGTPAAIHKIRHVVVIMQENRSFDSYFGTYPGADGIPGLAGHPGTVPCLPDPQRKHCDRSYHDTSDVNYGGPHGNADAIADIDEGAMDGFVGQAEVGLASYCEANFTDPRCSLAPKRPDVMGYHDKREIPNYWDYAKHFVLQDHMFESDASWSLPEHLYLVSGWSAKCTKKDDPMSCHSAVQDPANPPSGPLRATGEEPPDYAWTDLTYLLHRYGVSWSYYVQKGAQPDCTDDQMFCAPVPQNAHTPGVWNPLLWFDTVRHDHQLLDIKPLQALFTDLRDNTLPSISWIVPATRTASTRPLSSAADRRT